MVERHERRIVFALVALAVALRVGFALALPAFQSPDERAHLDYVLHLADRGSLPVQPDLSPEEAFARWPQSYQPPLAYLSFVPVAAALGSAGPGVRLRALRLQNALYGALLVAVVAAIARRLRPQGHALRTLAPLLVALLPGLVANAAALNNDALANLLAAALFLVWLAAPPGPRRGLGLGLLFGAACLTKLTVATLAPLLLAVPCLERRGLRAAATECAAATGVALLLLLPWMLRNLAHYGDLLAVGAGSFPLDALEGALPAELLAQAREPAPGKALLQLFGRFGVANNLSWWPVSAVWPALALLCLAGWLRPRRDPVGAESGADQAWVASFLLAVLLACAGLVAFSLRYYGAWQGRYLYVAVAPIAILLCEGGARWLAPHRAVLVVALLALLLTLLDAALLWQLDGFFEATPRRGWSERAAL